VADSVHIYMVAREEAVLFGPSSSSAIRWF